MCVCSRLPDARFYQAIGQILLILSSFVHPLQAFCFGGGFKSKYVYKIKKKIVLKTNTNKETNSNFFNSKGLHLLLIAKNYIKITKLQQLNLIGYCCRPFIYLFYDGKKREPVTPAHETACQSQTTSENGNSLKNGYNF